MGHVTTFVGIDAHKKDLFVAMFTEVHSSSDGGAVLLKAVDRRLGLLDRLAGVLADPRDATRVRHRTRDLLAQRVCGIACGHADANDADALADDPIHKLLLDRDPIDGARLASEPTLSRFEQQRQEALHLSDVYRYQHLCS